MGQEATCVCLWNGEPREVKALLEPPELILRGGIRRRIPFVAMSKVRAGDDGLHFSLQDESFALALGAALAERWAQSLLKPPASLAKKLGIGSDTIVRAIGKLDDPALEATLAEAKAVSVRKGDIILARVETPADLALALKKAAPDLALGVPIWLVYRKGPGHALNESMVRSVGLAAGIVDTKVASVSAQLTGLRFVLRKKP
jgi:hypothetical protein